MTGKEKDKDKLDIFDRFNNGEINILIGTKVIGEGIDLPRANVLILGGGGKAKSRIIQNVGRVLRLHPGKTWALVYDFMDTGASYLEEHAEIRGSIYREYY